jgi:hypothetical protein
MIGTLLMLTLQTPSASALPPAAALARLEESFAPAMTATQAAAGRSLTLCPLTDLELAVEDPVTRSPGRVRARVYEPLRQADRGLGRTVLVLPPTGGENVLDQGYANTLCANGFRAVIVQSWFRQTEARLDMGMHDEGAVRALSAIRHVLDWLDPSRPTQVGILGTSVGALSSALALGFDARLGSAVLIVGGVGMPEIIAATTEKGGAALREARMKAFGLETQADYLAALRERVTIDPADFAGFSGRKNVLAFVGTNDLTVPTANQRRLVKDFAAESDEYAGDHTQTILHTFAWKRGKIVEFFGRTLR